MNTPSKRSLAIVSGVDSLSALRLPHAASTEAELSESAATSDREMTLALDFFRLSFLL